MPINPEKLRESLARAKTLMSSEDFNNKVSMNRNMSSTPRNVRPSQGNYDGRSQRDIDDRALYNESTIEGELVQFGAIKPSVSKPSLSLNGPITENSVKKSRLPKEILKSMVENPVAFPTDETIFENFMPKTEKVLTEDRYSQPVAQEQPQQPQYYTAQPSIDYSLIKTLIDESVKRNLTEMKSSLLTEGTQNILKMMRISNGNKIQAVDVKGNLYEGTLTLKKNILKK